MNAKIKETFSKVSKDAGNSYSKEDFLYLISGETTQEYLDAMLAIYEKLSEAERQAIIKYASDARDDGISEGYSGCL